MSNLIEHLKESGSNSSLWEIVQDNALAIIKLVAIAFAILVLARLLEIPFVYGFFADHLSSDFGLQDVYARPFAIALTALTVAATPTLLLATLFGYRAMEVFVWILGSSIVMATATYFFTGDVYFDRVTGKSQKCYAKTLEGFKFSSTCDFDPKLGVRFQEITSDVVKEIVFWQKNGVLKNLPTVKDGQYFDPLTGESVVWYSLNSNGSIRLFSLPGFDPATGESLKPITKKVIDEYELDTEMSTTIADTYKSESLLSDIELALADGDGQYESTKSSRQALDNIWKWYFIQKSAQGSSESFSSTNLDMKLATINVESLIKIDSYVIVVINFTAKNGGVDIYGPISIRDKDSHNVSSSFRPEIYGLKDWVHWLDDDRNLNLRLNPKESIRVMCFIKDMDVKQLRSGYVKFGPHTIEYKT